MSDVLRSYTGRVNPSRRSRRKRRKPVFSTFLVLLALACLAWALFITRDTHEIPRLVPADQAYQVYMFNVLEKRPDLLGSAVWDLLPEDSPYVALRSRWVADLPIPDWIANNLLYGICHASGQDLRDFRDILFVTKMSRVGCLVERFRSFFVDMGQDPAGGLNLRVLPGKTGYYAVRGRVLVASPSRKALIRSLTLSEDQALSPTEFARGAAGAMERDVFAMLRPDREDFLGDSFRTIDVTLQVRPDGLVLAASGDLREACRARYAPLLDGMSGGRAVTPAEGLMTVAVDVGQPFPAFLERLDGLLSKSGASSPLAPVVHLLRDPPDTATPLATVLPAFARTVTGPGWLQWRGAALNAMVPLPVLLAGFEADAAFVTEVMGRFKSVPEQSGGDPNFVPRYDEASGMVHVPLIGGPDIEPSFGYRDGQLLLSNSRLALESALAKGITRESPASPANFRLRLRPAPACESIAAMGRQFADAGVLRDFTAASFKAFAADWCQQASKVREVSLALACEDGRVKLRIDLAMASGVN